MAYLNENYLKLQAGYLFPEVARRVREFCEANPEAATRLIRCGIGDVTEPLPRAAIDAMKGLSKNLAIARRFAAMAPNMATNF
jgi:LL-diaminopimelate aminotransferase